MIFFNIFFFLKTHLPWKASQFYFVRSSEEFSSEKTEIEI